MHQPQHSIRLMALMFWWTVDGIGHSTDTLTTLVYFILLFHYSVVIIAKQTFTNHEVWAVIIIYYVY